MAENASTLSPIIENSDGAAASRSQITLLEPPSIDSTQKRLGTPSGSGSESPSVGRPRTATLESSVGPSLSAARSRDDVRSQDNNERERPTTPQIRTLPAWIQSVDVHEDDSDATTHLLPPGEAVVAQHNFSPHSKQGVDINGSKENGLGVPTDQEERQSRWWTFARPIAYPLDRSLEEQVVTPEWLNQNLGDYSQPWLAGPRGEEDLEKALAPKKQRQIWYRRFQTTLFRSPIVPLIFRLTVWVFSLTALALGGSIQHLANAYGHPQGPSGIMAIVVDAVALVYIVYVTWDEYTGKPLGLRKPRSKMRLIFLDLFFIVFDSANLSLAFEALSDVTGSCTEAQINNAYDPRNDKICDRQKALASVLLIALIAWLMTFAVSVLRVVERVSQ
ncbi:hypothetical protein AOR_1_1036194 [Paecilomyces variotii No. 5]|uniref:Regulator of phospholipase D SRF1 n=1 Tax=Byssochlamys spectabilis (strain No. 5 / NBRC 109023) TaxID=1356009 RepID=V5G6S0_BYSSN|nr:hypothetical protein AOR_1_1036194 [Paecilomyces variotii No. 5]